MNPDDLTHFLATGGIALLIAGFLTVRVLPEVFTSRCAEAERQAQGNAEVPELSQELFVRAARNSIRAFRLGQFLFLLGGLCIACGIARFMFW